MKTFRQLFLVLTMMVIASGITLAQRVHRPNSAADSTAKHNGWRHDDGQHHFGLSDSCWKVFVAELPNDVAGTLTGAIEQVKDIKANIDTLRDSLRAERKEKDTAAVHATWDKIRDQIAKARDDHKIIDDIIAKYHEILVKVHRECDTTTKGTVGLKVTPIMPNPATTKAHFSYTINAAEEVQITISDQVGTIVKKVFDGQVSAGEHDVQLDLSGLQSGMYLLRIQAGPDVNTLKLVIAN
jgi:hypothetical protein